MKKELFQTIFIESNNYSTIENTINTYFEELEDSGNLFLLVNNTYSDGFIETSFFNYIELCTKNNFDYINTIIIPFKNHEDIGLNKNIKYLLWFAKDHKQMYFNKDMIREKHIWKDVEWGKRSKNYNPKGKDPSNVWIPTLDNGKGKITKHILLTLEDTINRCIVSSSKDNQKIYIQSYSDIDLKKLKFNKNIIYEKYILSSKKTDAENNKLTLLSTSTKQKIEYKADVFFKSSEQMIELKDKSINLMVTSPPYWDLKNYFKEGQIGQESYEEYLSRLTKIWSETYRVLRDDGHMWININTRTKNKKPILIPHDIINSCLNLGFKLKDIIIWHKSSGIPTHKNNLVDKHEYFLWFTKSSSYKFNFDYVKDIKDYQNSYLNKGLLWNINRKAGSVGKDFIHPAIYPLKLIDRVIKLTTHEGDIILDPFLGSGTTMFSAVKNSRNFVGYEYNESFKDLIKYRADNESIDTSLINFHTDVSNIPKQSKNTVFRKELNN